ncbi:hypothetical protein [Paenibacillus massiliensis]|uniref:hypothetical protein n=1 Tax=Paenibacillus massiliensis TaxID=225917 RepID=UPI000371BD06|nr:hypothetical protein [Paenibacillus massiliensis]
MFITEVVAKIWEPVSQEYRKAHLQAEQLSDEELYAIVEDRLQHADNFVVNSREINMTRVLTTGCAHNHKSGTFAGCSMCDYMSFHADMLAVVSLLKTRRPDLYAQAMRFSFDHARGKSPKPGTVELVTGHDCLNPEEIPDEAFDEMFNKESLFSRRPYMTIFETRVNSITHERLLKWKDKLGKKVAVEVGIEVWNEWVRNHWIHKNLRERKIVEAIQIVKDTGCEMSANILIGLPGVTEEWSIQLFKETFFKLCDLGAHYVLCSPLSRKEKTLQGYLHRGLQSNARLSELGLARGEETGMPSVFTVAEAIIQVSQERPELLSRMVLSPLNFPAYLELQLGIHRENPEMTACINVLGDAFKQFAADKNVAALLEAYKGLHDTESYASYVALKDRQRNAGSLRSMFRTLGEEIAKDLWPDEWEQKIAVLESELASLSEPAVPSV